MLSLLTIDNIALISHGELGFSHGFAVLTGETGAGKSIIIDSISLILGARANKDLIRSGETQAQVEAIFDRFNPIELQELQDLNVDVSDGQLMLSRQIFADGRSVSRINGKAVTLGMLRQVAGVLVNIHGQHECQMLTDEKRHLALLDMYAENSAEREAYRKSYTDAKAIQKRILDMSNDEKSKRERTEYLKYVLEEIKRVDPKKNELELLLAKKEKAENSALVNECVSDALVSLNGNDDTNGAISSLKKAAEALSRISSAIPSGDSLVSRLEEILVEAQDISACVGHFGVPDDEFGSIDDIEERLYSIEQLCKKYGGSLDSVLEAREKAQNELSEMENSEETLKRLAGEYADAKAKLAEAAKKLSASRKAASESLCKKVCEALEFLDMPGVRFFAEATEHKNSKGGVFYSPDGTEKIEFMISANVGEEPKPLAKIASGGELSRIILAIKSVLNEKEGTGTLIFDEVDTGVSGKTSYKVGIKLQRASRSSQIFCVTHSAQIASLADTHIKVSKSSKDGRSFTVAAELNREQRIMELARIMGGDIISKTLLDSAKELIAQSDEIKKN